MMTELLNNVRYGVRGLARNPGFALAAIATLTIAIGASTAAFSIVNGILLAPLPFEEPDELVGFADRFFDLELLADFRDESRTLAGLAASTSITANVDQDGAPQEVDISLVTAGYFEVLRVQPVLGRLFDTEELLADGTKPAVIDYSYWQGNWGGRPDVIGQTLRLEGQPAMTIVGVLPATFRSPSDAGPPTAVLTSVEASREGFRRSYDVVGRLMPGESIESAQAEIDLLADRLSEGANERGVVVRPLTERVVGPDSRRSILIFAVAVGMVLLIGVLNLVNLQASRISRRERELSIRGALGASRWRLIRQMISEAMILTFSGAGLGFLAVYSIRDIALANMPPLLPRMSDVPVDGRVFAFAVAVALVSGLAIGIVPALRASRLELNDTLKDGATNATETRHQRWLRSVLTVAQTSLAVVLLVGAGLLIESFARLISVDPGFDLENVISARISLPRRYAEVSSQQGLLNTLLDEIRSLPEVEYASLTRQLPMGGQGITLFSRRTADVVDPVAMAPAMVAADYGQTMGIPLVSGRWIDENDVATGDPVAVISESIIRQFFPGQNPIGQRLDVFGGAQESPTVIGVVRGVRVSMRGEPAAYLYIPYTADLDIRSPLPWNGNATLVARVRPGAQVSLEQAILRIEPESVVTVTSMDRLIATNVQRERFQTAVLSSFAGAALVLAMLGVYSVVAFSTAQRSREIGLRMAMGARARDVIFQMMRHGLVPAILGLALGTVASVQLTRFLQSYLFEIEAADSWVYTVVMIGGIALVVVASWLPARRAARFDPMSALRYE